MIRFDEVSLSYSEAAHPVVSGASFAVEEGSFVLVIGRTGSGKSTLLGAMNGLVPHFTGGRLDGRVTMAGRDTRDFPPRELADVVGLVGQDPLAGFVTDTVEEELAYVMEQLAIPAPVMRKRVEETLDLLGIAELRKRPLRALSGGQQQRVAIGAALTAQPQVLVLDEPTSALDPTAAEDVLATLERLVRDLGITVVVAEHRLERVIHFADSIMYLTGDGTVSVGAPSSIIAEASVAPPVVELGRFAGWDPLPLSVRDARRSSAGLRERLRSADPDGERLRSRHGRLGAERSGGREVSEVRGATGVTSATGGQSTPNAHGYQLALQARGVVVQYGRLVAVQGVDLDLYAGQVVALMGRNGSGKSSLLWALQGSGPRDGGSVDVGGRDPGKLNAAGARALVSLVPQTPSDLLYLETVSLECAVADDDAGVESGRCGELLEALAPGIDPSRHPRDLSEGQRLALVLAIQICAAPRVVFLDEPTRGLDYPGKEQLARMVARLASEGRAVVVATHDVEFVADVADRVVMMAQGEIVVDGPTDEVITATPFAPQVAKILAPAPYLNVADVQFVLDTSELTEPK